MGESAARRAPDSTRPKCLTHALRNAIAKRTVGRKVPLERFKQMPSHAGIATFGLSLSHDAAPLGYDLLAFRNLFLGFLQVLKSNGT